MPQKLSFPDFKDHTSKELELAKTKIGEHAGEKKYYSTVLDPKTSREDKLESIKSARDEADNEVKRETRGKVIGLRKPGFKEVGTASSRADGCATKGKTKGRFV